jgi:sterol 3beta-glucosyltransferase
MPRCQEPYFPNGDVSLHYVTSVQASKKNPLHFKVLTADRDLRFAAESTAQRDDWVKTLTKAVFQCQNEGDSVKVRASCSPLQLY